MKRKTGRQGGGGGEGGFGKIYIPGPRACRCTRSLTAAVGIRSAKNQRWCTKQVKNGRGGGGEGRGKVGGWGDGEGMMYSPSPRSVVQVLEVCCSNQASKRTPEVMHSVSQKLKWRGS